MWLVSGMKERAVSILHVQIVSLSSSKIARGGDGLIDEGLTSKVDVKKLVGFVGLGLSWVGLWEEWSSV